MNPVRSVWHVGGGADPKCFGFVLLASRRGFAGRGLVEAPHLITKVTRAFMISKIELRRFAGVRRTSEASATAVRSRNPERTAKRAQPKDLRMEVAVSHRRSALSIGQFAHRAVRAGRISTTTCDHAIYPVWSARAKKHTSARAAGVSVHSGQTCITVEGSPRFPPAPTSCVRFEEVANASRDAEQFLILAGYL
jgi:hypothetical protein